MSPDGAVAPAGVLTNADLERMVDTSDEWIVQRTGIRERRVAAAHETTASMAAVASLRAIRTAGLQPDDIDLILLMSVNPGFGGQGFIDSTLRKIEAARKRIEASGKDIRLEVDGGIKTDNIRRVADAGADTFVAGSAIFGQPDYKAVIDAMRAAMGPAPWCSRRRRSPVAVSVSR